MGNQTHQYSDGTLVRQIDYGAIGKPSRIRSYNTDVANNSSPGDSFYTYDGSRNLVKRYVTEQGSTKIFYQHGGVELIKEGTNRRYRRTFANAIVERSGNTLHTSYVYTDHLGSVDVITNALGQLLEKLSFDAFGKRRQVYTAAHVPVALSLASILNKTSRGFTGHLQVDHASIVHMGGRIYDSHIGRFLQADPFVQSPSNSQNFNRYSYVLNNPLSYTDPSGYLFKSIKKHWRTIAAIAIAVYMPHLAIMQGLNAATVGAITGFVAGAVSTGSLKGALVGAFTGGMFGHLHSMNAGFGKVIAHGAVGGMGSVLQGGKFGHGFAAAGFTQAASWAGGDNLFVEGASTIGDRTHNAVIAAMIGGTASSIAGGKFANGAVTGAFSRLLNDDATNKVRERQIKVLSEEIHNDAKNRMHELSKWRADKNWDAIRSKYPVFNSISDNNMSVSSMALQVEFQHIAYRHVGGYLSNSVMDGVHRTVELAAGVVKPNKLNLLQSIYSFISGPPPPPFQHQFVVSKVDAVAIDIVRRKP